MFPLIEAHNLQGQKLVLPGDLEAKFNLLILAFSHGQQADVESWKKRVEPLRARWPDLSFYELPTIEDPGLLARKLIDGGMRLGIQDPDAREHTIPLYLKRVPFLEALDIPSDDAIHVLLVDREGQILWQTEGSWTEGKELVLEDLLRREHLPPEQPQLH